MKQIKIAILALCASLSIANSAMDRALIQKQNDFGSMQQFNARSAEQSGEEDFASMVSIMPENVRRTIQSKFVGIKKAQVQIEGLKYRLEQSTDRRIKATRDEYNAIVDIPQSFRKSVDGTCIVEPTFADKAWRVGKTAAVTSLVGGLSGGIIGGFLGSDTLSKESLAYAQHKELTRQKQYDITFQSSYPQLHKDYVWKKIAKDGCLADVFADKLILWSDRPFEAQDIRSPQDPATFEDRVGRLVRDGRNPADAFNEIAQQTCFETYEKEAQIYAMNVAGQLALEASVAAVNALPKPEFSTFSWNDAKVGGLYGAGAGAVTGVTLSLYNGDLSRPIAQEKIADMNKKLEKSWLGW